MVSTTSISMAVALSDFGGPDEGWVERSIRDRLCRVQNSLLHLPANGTHWTISKQGVTDQIGVLERKLS